MENILLGTKAGKQVIIKADGVKYGELREQFNRMSRADGEGFSKIELWRSARGRVRSWTAPMQDDKKEVLKKPVVKSGKK